MLVGTVDPVAYCAKDSSYCLEKIGIGGRMCCNGFWVIWL